MVRKYQDNQGRVWIEDEDGGIVEPSDIPADLLTAAMRKGPEFTENFIAAATPGGIERQEREKQAQLVRREQLPLKLGSPREFFDKLGFKFGTQLDKKLQEGQLPEGWKKIADPGHSMYSYVLDPKGCRRWTIFFKGAFYDYEAFGWSLQRRFVVSVEKDYKAEIGPRAVWGEIHDNAVPFDAKAKEGRYVTPKIVYRSQEDRFTPKSWEDGERLEAMVRLEMEMWIEANYPDYENPLAYWE